MSRPSVQGGLLATAAFTLWGAFPYYFNAVAHIAPLQVLASRIVWSAVLLSLVVWWLRRWRQVIVTLSNRDDLRPLLIATLLIATNWGVYIWSVVSQQLFQASLGYYINPLLNVLLGLLFLQEKLRRFQWLAVALAVVGVGLQMGYLESFPWIACVLGLSFGLYGLIHKRIAVDSLSGLCIETFLLLPVALLFFTTLAWQQQGPVAWQPVDWGLLILAGPVTVVPLLLFTAAAKRINYSILGFFQYITPSVLFFLAAFYYREPFNDLTIWSFGFIWLALLVLSVDAMVYQRKLRVSINV